MSARIEIQASDEYGPLVEEKLSELLPLARQEQVEVAPIQSLRDPVTTGIAVAVIGSVGPVLVREIFRTVREIVRDSHKRKKPVRSVIRHKGRDHVIATGDEADDL